MMKDGEDMTDTGFFDDSTVVGELRLTGDKVYPYEVRVSNSYTGVSRIVCAGTRWELETLLESEKKRQRSEEVIKRAMSISPDERSAARIMTENTQGIFEEYRNIIAHTLEIDDRLDWDKRLIVGEYPEFHPEPAPIKNISEKKGIAKLFYDSAKDEEIYRREVEEYKSRVETEIRNYLLEKEKFEENKRQNNAEVKFLRKCFEAGEKTAIEKYAGVILANSEYPGTFEKDSEIFYDKVTKTLTVNFLFFPIAVMPSVESYEYSLELQRIVEKHLDEKSKNKMYEQILQDVALRTLHELYEAIYTDSVQSIIFNAFVLNGKRWIEGRAKAISPSGKMRCVFSVRAHREEFSGIDISSENSEKLLRRFEFVRVKNHFSDVTEMMNPIVAEHGK